MSVTLDNAMSDPSTSALAKLYQPFAFGRTTLRNRIVMAPMTRNSSPGGVPTDAVAAYYARRASGGAGLIVTEGTYIDHPAANGYADVPAFFGAGLDGWSRVVRAVHAEGAAIMPQLWHVGAVRRPGMEPDRAVPGMGPMDVFENGERVVQAMTHADIADVAASYARAATNAVELGCDAVEIHGAHGYLLDQFFWAESNRRDDEYGGSIAARVRIGAEVVAAMRAAVPMFRKVPQTRTTQRRHTRWCARSGAHHETPVLYHRCRPGAERLLDDFRSES